MISTMHKADKAYSNKSVWLYYQLAQFRSHEITQLLTTTTKFVAHSHFAGYVAFIYALCLVGPETGRAASSHFQNFVVFSMIITSMR